MESDIEVIYRKVRDSKDKPLLTDPKGLENGYFIRQYINDEECAPRYTLAFNPEGTVKTQIGYELPYVIECFGNDHDGTNTWAIHVFDTREDMVAALNYDLKVRDRYSSKNFGDSIGELNITRDVLSIENTTPVFAAWMDAFGAPFIKNMMSRDIFSDGYFSIKQGIKTFGPVFISEKTGSLAVKGVIRERYSDRNHNFVWFSDTKEVLLELQNAIPKFNDHGIFYDVDSEHLKTGETIYFNPLYTNMEDKILSKFHTWDGSELKNLVFFNEDDVKETLDARARYQAEEQPLTTELKGLENGYVIRQHKNSHNSYRYTLAFNPEGTLKVEGDIAKPYVIECFGNDHDGTNTWAIHVFDTREDMVAALNYDLKVRDRYSSKNFGDSIGELNITRDVLSIENTTPVFAAWMDAFGAPFIKNMMSRDIFSDGYFSIKQGIKTFGPVFISEKTGSLAVKGVIRERYSDRNHNFVWFSDTKEVLLELQNAIPKFNDHGIFYDVDSEHLKTGETIYFNPLYTNMEDKILSKFHTWDGSELKNLVFFNEDGPLNNEFREKKFQIPGDLSEKKSGNTDGSDDFDRSFGHI